MAENDVKKEGDEGFEKWCNDNLADESTTATPGEIEQILSEGQPAADVVEDLTTLGAEDASPGLDDLFGADPITQHTDDTEEAGGVQEVPNYTVQQIAEMIATSDLENVKTSVQCFVKAEDESVTYCGMMFDKCFIMRKPKGDGETKVVVSDAVSRIIGVTLEYTGEGEFDTITLGIVRDTICVTRYDYQYNVVKSVGIAHISAFQNVTMINKVGDKFVIGCSMVDSESGVDVQALCLISEDFETSNVTLLRHDLPATFENSGIKAEVRSCFGINDSMVVFGFIANDKDRFFVTLSTLNNEMQPGKFATVNVGDQFKTVGSYAWYNEEQGLINIVGFYMDDENKAVPFNAVFDLNLQHIVQSVVSPETAGMPN
jgi:hypothetical protein